jgi:hypothetical protein
MKTAIEELIDKFKILKDKSTTQKDSIYIDELILKLESKLQKEREQIENAFEKGGEEFSNAYKQTIYHGSKYYNETFKK